MSDPATTARYGTPLTPQERRCLLEMASARTIDHAARRLGLSPHTVRAYLRNARSRLGVRTTREALVKVLA